MVAGSSATHGPYFEPRGIGSFMLMCASAGASAAASRANKATCFIVAVAVAAERPLSLFVVSLLSLPCLASCRRVIEVNELILCRARTFSQRQPPQPGGLIPFSAAAAGGKVLSNHADKGSQELRRDHCIQCNQ